MFNLENTLSADDAISWSSEYIPPTGTLSLLRHIFFEINWLSHKHQVLPLGFIHSFCTKSVNHEIYSSPFARQRGITILLIFQNLRVLSLGNKFSLSFLCILFEFFRWIKLNSIHQLFTCSQLLSPLAQKSCIFFLASIVSIILYQLFIVSLRFENFRVLSLGK